LPKRAERGKMSTHVRVQRNPLSLPVNISRGVPMREFLRGVNESLIIDHHFEVKVLEIQPNHVRLAITSPHETELAELLHP
jgi:hypothetical protein